MPKGSIRVDYLKCWAIKKNKKEGERECNLKR
jgi:hypothetical protein